MSKNHDINTVIRPTMLVILDGFGYSLQPYGNAIAHAKMPMWDYLLKTYPNTLLQASGLAVGLPDGFIGNSEVGHLTIGAGCVIPSILKRFDDAINDESFYKNPLLLKSFELLKTRNKALHLMGLLSDAGVHSNEKHLYALLKMARDAGLTKVFIHAFLDGRDVVPKSAGRYLERLEAICNTLGCGIIASLHGRFYAMDRDTNWDRTKISYDVLVGKTKPCVLSWHDYLDKGFVEGITEEFIQPVLLNEEGFIKRDDGVVFFNFRADRARQLTQCFVDPDFTYFERKHLFSFDHSLAFFITTTRYKKEFENFNNLVLFEMSDIENTLLDQIAEKTTGAQSVFIIAETEKYAHVSYFFRGMRDIQLPHEQRVLIPSIKTKTFAEYPDMSAPQITKALLDSLQTNHAFFYLVNYANADMVGHSGNFEATVKACECLDAQLTALYDEVVLKQGGTIFIVADHGNAEEKIELGTGKPLTAHSRNPVRFVVVGDRYKNQNLFKEHDAGLSIVTPLIVRHLFG